MKIIGRRLTLLCLVALGGCYIDPGPSPYPAPSPSQSGYQGDPREDAYRTYWEQRQREREYWYRQNAQRPPYIPPPPPGPPPPPPPDLRR
jgi:hypothetical protein